MTNSMFRASDEDRARTVENLQQHTVAGRISFDELSERCASAYQSRTVGELAALTADLPRVPPGQVPEPSALSGMSPRLAVIAAMIATVLLIAGGLVATSPGGLPSPCVAEQCGGFRIFFWWVPAMAVPARYYPYS